MYHSPSQEFKVSGDNLRVVKLNVPDDVLMKYAQEFCFEKPLKCDRATYDRRKGVSRILKIVLKRRYSNCKEINAQKWL